MDAFQVGVLLGAGPCLSRSTREALSDLIKEVFSELENLLDAEDDISAEVTTTDAFLLKVIVRLGKLLESSPFTNAGSGSELTLDGKVECDASVMLGGSQGEEVSASVGAVPEIESPLELCARLIDQQTNTPSSAMLSVPVFLTGHGACEYGERLGMRRGNMISTRATESRNRWLARIKAPGELKPEDRYVDTVGLVLFFRGRSCVASSSGGSLLKESGRLGPAALIGRGLDLGSNCAAVCSGFGEDIIRLRYAQKCVECEDSLEAILESSKTSHIRLQRQPPYTGVLKGSMVSEEDPKSNKVLFEWSHATPSMICGFGGCVKYNKAKYEIVDSSTPATGGFMSSFQ